MSEFERNWTRLQREGDRIRRIAMVWSAFVLLLFIGGLILAGYALLHPEMIGIFVSRIVEGFEAGRA